MAKVQVAIADLLRMQAVAKQLPILSQHRVRSMLLGGHLSVMRGRGMEFAEVRAYQPGDDIRYMDWRVTARKGVPHTKLFQEERERPQYIITDFNPSMWFGTQGCFKVVLAAQAAAAFAWAASAQGDRIGGLLFAGESHVECRPRARQEGVMILLHALESFSKTRVKTHYPDSLLMTLERLRQVTKPGSVVTIISDFKHLHRSAGQLLNRLSTHNQVIAVWIRDPIECEPPEPGFYPVSDGTQVRMLNLHDKNQRAHYKSYCDHQAEQVEQTLSRYKIPCVSLLTNDDLSTALPREIEQLSVLT